MDTKFGAGKALAVLAAGGVVAAIAFVSPAFASAGVAEASRSHPAEAVASVAPLSNSAPAVGSASQVVAVSVAPVLVAPHDGLPQRLAAGRTYQTSITVLATQPGTQARATVTARGATLTGCDSVPLTPGTVEHLACTVVVAGDAPVTITVDATGGQGSRQTTAFRHAVAN